MTEREDQHIAGGLRQAVLERDGQCCRVCGRFCEYPALHHIEYRSEGGQDSLENLITIGWTPGHDCHLSVVHANKRVWQPILKAIVLSPPLTAYGVRRAQLRAVPPRVERALVGWPTPPISTTALPTQQR